MDLSLVLNISRSSSGSYLPDRSIPDHLTEHCFNSRGAYIRKDLYDIRFRNRRRAVEDRRLYSRLFCNLAASNHRKPLVQLLVAHIYCCQEFHDKSGIVILIIMPAIGGLLQCIVVVSFPIVDLFLK